MDYRSLRSLAGMAASTYACCQYANLYVRCIYDELALYSRTFAD